VNFEDINSEH